MASTPRSPRDPGGREDRFVFPASHAQQRVWFLEQLEPGTHVFNLPQAFRLEGALNVEALERSFQEIVQRHESLRTTFVEEKDGPVQVIHPPGDFQISRRDLDGGEWDRERAPGIVTERARMPFDLSRGPLFRVELFRLRPHEHVVLVNMHHIVSDGWSLGVLHRELEALYGAFARGKASPLADLPIQYADYAVWQSRRLTGDVLERERAYWRGKLAGVPEVLSLPTDRARPGVQTFRGAKVSMKLPAAVSEAVRRLGQADAATPFMVLLAAFQVLLSRYAQQQDVAIGTTVANRDRHETEGLIGFFVNTLVLRTDLAGDPTFRELVRRVRSVALEAYAHAELPFEKLVQDLSPRRQLSHTPLFQVLFGLRSPMAVPQLDGLSVSRMALDSETAKFDLTMILEDAGPEIAGWLQYNADLFDASTAARMVEHFEVLLKGIVTNPDERVSRLPVMSEGEQERVLVEWNRTTVAYPRDETVQMLFEAQVDRSPESFAVEFEGEQLTYRDLNRRANQLAHHLKDIGVGPEVLVGVALERSLDMVVALLGTLKAGGAYVPLDPTFPRERLAFMLEDTQAPVLLTQEKLLATLPSSSARMLCLDRDRREIDRSPVANPDSTSCPDNLAYVIYTSGSTGKPKGVQVAQASVVNFLRAMRETLDWSPEERSLLLTRLSFDISGLEIYLPLFSGGFIRLVSPGAAGDPRELEREAAASGATAIQATPATWQMLVESGWKASPDLKVLCGGEGLPVGLARDLLQSGATVWNLYGPTETTIWSTAYELPRELPDVSLAPIGRPIANTRAYVLDDAWQPMPVGLPGELYLGGAGLARGYLRRPDLTAEKFLPDPWSAIGGDRLYRTGDRVRYLADGTIEFLGRGDNQVKVRGHRIELGEIEAVLRTHPDVVEAVVLALEEKPGDRRLVGYVVGPDTHSPAGSQLREFLESRLPNHMIPGTIVQLDRFPLTPSGKVDRRALPFPGQTRSEVERQIVAPRNAVEEVKIR